MKFIKLDLYLEVTEVKYGTLVCLLIASQVIKSESLNLVTTSTTMRNMKSLKVSDLDLLSKVTKVKQLLNDFRTINDVTIKLLKSSNY